MALQAAYTKHTLRFTFEAGTSRGVLTERDTYYLKLFDDTHPQVYGLGECSPLKGLSIDDRPDFEAHLQALCEKVTELSLNSTQDETEAYFRRVVGNAFPAIQFGWETAWLDYRHGGRRLLFPGPFTEGQLAIPINGLIWMGPEAFMQKQIEEKLTQGYRCLKMKIGAIDFDTECRLLASIRERFPADQITLRVDANGAFSPAEAMDKLRRLTSFGLHSIEQPIKPNQPNAMAALCQSSPVPIALDEELIGINTYAAKRQLLETLLPPYIILKPTLLGGFQHCLEWIELANTYQIGWWMTSALEANIGLNAISQFTASLGPSLPQGLGTGQLYHNNMAAPLQIRHGFLRYNPDVTWGQVPGIEQ